MLRRAVGHLVHYPFRVWGFGEGIGVRALLSAAQVLHDTMYQGFAHGLFGAWIGRGAARHSEDHAAPGVELLELYRRTGQATLLDTATALAQLHLSFPRINDAGLHRADQLGWRRQIWVDCMHVDGPFLASLGSVTGEERWYDEAGRQLLAYARLLQEQDGLFRHGWEAACGPNGQLWARGNGWALTGLVDTLDFLPRAHPARAEIAARAQCQLQALAATQAASGLWHTVVDIPATYEETTLAAMLAIALRLARRRALFDTAPFEAMRARAEEAVLRQVDDEGVLRLVSEATPVAERSVYATRPFGIYPWGQGPLALLLCARIEDQSHENRQS